MSLGQYNLGWQEAAAWQAKSKSLPPDADPLGTPDGWRRRSDEYKTGWLDYLNKLSDNPNANPMRTQVQTLRDQVAHLSALRQGEPGLDWVVRRLDDILLDSK
jgi:hypothetical protein